MDMSILISRIFARSSLASRDQNDRIDLTSLTTTLPSIQCIIIIRVRRTRDLPSSVVIIAAHLSTPLPPPARWVPFLRSGEMARRYWTKKTWRGLALSRQPPSIASTSIRINMRPFLGRLRRVEAWIMTARLCATRRRRILRAHES